MNPITSSKQIATVLESQRNFFDAGGMRNLTNRINSLKRLEKVLIKNEAAILEALKEDLNKPEHEAYLAEYYFLIQEIRMVNRSLKKWLKPRRVKTPFYFLPSRSWIKRAPHGSTLIMAPWNYPIQLSLSPLVSAVAAGNTVVLKPSEASPNSEKLIARLIEESFPPEHVTVIRGDSKTAEELLEQSFDFIFFTGSTKIGHIVAQKAAKKLIPHVLELGGKCPVIVEASADLSLTAKRIIAGKMMNAGQTCFAPDYVVVHEDVKDNFVAELKSQLQLLPWENDMASIINQQHYHRLQSLLSDKAIKKGEDDPDRLHLAPRILPDINWEDRIMQEEIFGPLLPVLTWSTFEQLSCKLKNLPAPLALYCFSRDKKFIEKLLDQIPSGSACINDTMKQATNLNLPFGGVGASGHGRYRGKAGVEAFSYERAISQRYFVRDPFEILPPFTDKLDQLKKWLH